MGRPIIITTDPEFSYFVFQEEGKLFQSWYPDTFVEILGKQNMGALHGILHKCLKNMVLNLFGPESLKKMLPAVEQAACRNLKRWSSQESVELKDSIASVSSCYSMASLLVQYSIPALWKENIYNSWCLQMIFALTAKKLINYDQEKSSDNLRECFVAFIRGLISFPLDIPGTAYHKCLQVCKTFH